MSGFNWIKDGEYFVYAEYCSGLFGFAYMGWWLYAAPLIDGVIDKEQAVWLHCDWELDAVLGGLGIPKNGHSEYTDAFREKHPAGIRCSVEGFGYAGKVKALNQTNN